MNLWSLLGVSVGVVALFSIGMNELCRNQAFYDTYRWFILVGFGWLGVILFIIGRIKSARLGKRIQAHLEQARNPTQPPFGVQAEEGPPERPFFFFSLTYWGVMLLIFGVVILIISPPPTPVQAREAAPEKQPPKTAKVVAEEEEPEEEPSTPFPELKMQGVVLKKPRPSVLINGRTYFEGDSIEEVKVLKIEPASVTVQFRGEERVLTLE